MFDCQEGDERETGDSSYWSAPLPVAVSELHDALRRELATRRASNGYRAYVTSIVDEPRVEPNGWFELAIDEAAGRACVIYADRICCAGGNLRVAATEPCWLSARNPLDAAEAMFRKLLDE